MPEIENKTWTELGLELLVEMSSKGEIDPWDVDLVFVIDKFLNQLSQSESKQELQEAARIIFFVSVLLKIKSQNLYQKPEQTEEKNDYGDLIDFEEIEFEELSEQQNNYSQALNPKTLDKVLMRNPKMLKETRKRKITLDELIDIFKKSESKNNVPKKRKKKNLQDFMDEGEIVLREDEETDILELAHDENLEYKIQLLSEYIFKTLELQKETSLSEIKENIGDWVDTFLSALFLSHSGKTELWQKSFYEEIWLKRIA